MKKNRYRVTVEPLTDARDAPGEREPLQFEIADHDDLLSLVTRLRARDDFSRQDEAAAFGVGLKLLAGVVLDNRDNPLFASFLPQLQQFVKAFKAEMAPIRKG